MKQLLITIAAVVLVGCVSNKSIYEVAEKGNIKVVKQHLAAGTDVNAKDDEGMTPLHLAAHADHKKIVELLIAKGADVNAKDNMGFTPLMVRSTKEIGELLIAKGADVNAKNDSGRTCLHSSDKEFAELLIAKGADVNAKDKDDETPLDWCIKRGNKETADLLRKHGGKYGTIHGAVGGGDIEVIKVFLAAGADVNVKNDYGETPLDWAIQFKRTEIANLLRKHGGKRSLALQPFLLR